MNQELMTLVNNVQSLVEQIKQVAGAGKGTEIKKNEEEQSMDDIENIKKFLKELEDETGSEAPEGEEMPIAPDEGEEEDAVTMTDDMDEDDEVQKSDNGTTANDTAEARIEDMDEVNEDNIKEVAKTLVRLMSKSRVKKSRASAVSVDKKVLKALISKVQEQDKAIASILSGFGIADQVKKSFESKQAQVVHKSADADTIHKSMESFKDEIKNLISQGQKNESGINGSHVVAKSLADNDGLALRAIFSNAFRNSQR